MNWPVIKLRLLGRPVRLTTALSVSDCKKRLHVRFSRTSRTLLSERLSGYILGNYAFIGLDLFSWLNQATDPKLILRLQAQAHGTTVTGRAIPGFGFLLALMFTPVLLGFGMFFGGMKLLQSAPPNIASPTTYIIVKWALAIILLASLLGFIWLISLDRKEEAYDKMTKKMQKLLDAEIG
ncbi:hypothetical protein [Blastomonas sp.]|uniref:hypothetical protein n=1 Tax=Blastomonas sp. TaxID=1909299 RepID=UPI00391DDCE4